MSARRWLTLFVGLALWCVGFWLFLDNRYVLGGVLVLAGGLCGVVAASAGGASSLRV